MEPKEIQKKLSEPFRQHDLEFRLQSCGEKSGGNGFWGIALTYVTSRAIMSRLDEVLGFDKWSVEHKPIEGGFICYLTLEIDGKKVTKTGVAQFTKVEPLKGGASDSLKRAAIQFGVGRYLYDLPATFVNCDSQRPPKAEMLKWSEGKTKNNTRFWWEKPVLPEWALHPDDSLCINRDEANALCDLASSLGVYSEFENHWKSAYNIDRMGHIKTSELTVLSDWINEKAKAKANV